MFASLSVPSSAWNNSVPPGRVFLKFDIGAPFENLSRKFKFNKNLTRITCTLRDDRYVFLIISRLVLRRMENFLDKSCRENQNPHFMFSNFFSRKSCRLWDNVERYSRARQATDNSTTHVHFMPNNKSYRHTRRICTTACSSTATVVYERASMLRYV
jgi:hypothetical protein